jgi:hypothetical protein
LTGLSNTVLAATIQSIRSALRRGPSQQGQFLWWGLDDHTPEHDTFAQITGLVQLSNLSANLLGDLLPEAQYPEIASYCGAINAYFFYEIISDNLAHGFGPLAFHDPTYLQRRDLLQHFNEAMIARLSGNTDDADHRMETLKHKCKAVSSLDHNLNADKRDALLKIYAAATGASPEQAEFDLWSLLRQNMAACADLIDLLDGSPFQPALRHGLSQRYQSLNALMRNDSTSVEDLLASSTWTILIVPTLVFYTAALSQVTPLATPVEDDLLNEAVYSAAVLVRLLNDLGSLMTLPEATFRSDMDALRSTYQAHADTYPDILSFLLATAPTMPCLTRLHKDLRHGEHNVGLYQLAAEAPVEPMLDELESNLHYYRRVYRQQINHLLGLLDQLSEQCGDARPSQLIERIVVFHEQMYAVPFEERAGEYAI